MPVNVTAFGTDERSEFRFPYHSHPTFAFALIPAVFQLVFAFRCECLILRHIRPFPAGSLSILSHVIG